MIDPVRTWSRGAGVGRDGVMAMLPWDCGLSEYRSRDGTLVPMAGEAAWLRPEGGTAYVLGHVKTVRYGFLP